MSKAENTPATPTPNRRLILAGAAGIAAAGALSTAALALPLLASSPRITRLREISARIVEMEQTPGYVEAHEEELGALLDQISTVAEEVWASPVRAPMDILERTLVAHSYCADGVGDNGEHVLCYFDAEDGPKGTRAVNHLIHAILELAGLPEGETHV